MVDILLIDDDPDDIFIFKQLCVELSQEIAINSIEGEHCTPEFLDVAPVPDLVLSDVNMPRLDGIECLQRIRKHERWTTVPVVMFSTHSDKEIITKAAEVGANYFIVKPNTTQELYLIIERLIDIIKAKLKGFK